MNLNDYIFVYKPSDSILMRERELDLRILGFEIKLSFHSLFINYRVKYPSGGPIGIHNNLPELFSEESLRQDRKAIYKQYGLNIGNYHTNEINNHSIETLLMAVKQIRQNKYRSVGVWINKPTIWQRIKSIFKSW